jgi:hypothetical protein
MFVTAIKKKLAEWIGLKQDGYRMNTKDPDGFLEKCVAPDESCVGDVVSSPFQPTVTLVEVQESSRSLHNLRRFFVINSHSLVQQITSWNHDFDPDLKSQGIKWKHKYSPHRKFRAKFFLILMNLDYYVTTYSCGRWKLRHFDNAKLSAL